VLAQRRGPTGGGRGILLRHPPNLQYGALHMNEKGVGSNDSTALG
jgi:hypothetical protein